MRHILEARGIDRAAVLMDWQEDKNYWKYPVRDWDTNEIIAYRMKAYPENQGAKYLWDNGKPENHHCEIYLHPKFFLPSVQEAGGRAYLVNGEPALLAMYQANIFNAFTTTLGEGQLPASIDAFLKAYGVQWIEHILDKDNAGQTDGAIWQAHLLKSPVEHKPYNLPANLPLKSDVNDLWIACDFEPETFKTALNSLRLALLPIERKNANLSRSTRKEYDFSDSLVQNILNAVGATGKRPNKEGFITISCPFTENHSHNDKNPSAGVSVDTGIINCFSCGKHLTHEVAGRLGLAIEQKAHEPAKPVEETPEMFIQKIRVEIKRGLTLTRANLSARNGAANDTIYAITQLAKLEDEIKQGGLTPGANMRFSELANLIK